LLGATANEPFGGLQAAMLLTMVGGVILFISGALYFTNVIGTLMTPAGSGAEVVVPESEALSGPENAPASLDNFRLWTGIAILLVILSYGPALWQVLQHSAWNAPGLIIK
jgi:cytochrome c oxidase subunit 1